MPFPLDLLAGVASLPPVVASLPEEEEEDEDEEERPDREEETMLRRDSEVTGSSDKVLRCAAGPRERG